MTVIRPHLCALLFALAVVPALAGQSPAGQSPKKLPRATLDPKVRADLLQWGEEARTHLRSTAIVRGVLHVDTKSVKEAVAKHGYARVRIDVRETIFGPARPSVTFHVFVPKGGVATRVGYSSSDEVTSWDGQDRIVFLHASGKDYLASDDKKKVMLEPTRETIVRVRQREMLHRELSRKPLRQDRALKKRVAKWVKRMVGGKEMQREAFDRLEEMGAAATVEIVAAMDSRRALPEASITLENKAADRFEATRHYSPKLVVDAVAAILNQNTGESFGFIYSDTTDAARAACVRGWTLYAYYLAEARTQDRGGKKSAAKKSAGK